MRKPIHASIRGKRAKTNGALFEQLLMNEARHCGFEVLRIPDGCKVLSNTRIIRVQSPFDLVLVNRETEQTIFCDAKTTQAGTFSPGLIKEHQVLELQKFSGLKMIRSGYIVAFEKHSQVVFFDVPALLDSARSRVGLKPENGLVLGHRYKLDLKCCFN